MYLAKQSWTKLGQESQ